MPETLVIPLSGQSVRASEAARRLLGSDNAVISPLGKLSNPKSIVGAKCDVLALVGAPPSEELGYGFVTLVALFGRPKRVALIDLRGDHVTWERLIPYILRSTPFLIGQVAGSAVAVLAQRATIPLVQRGSRVRTASMELRKLVYVLPVAGAASPVGGSVTHAHGVIRALRAEGVAVDPFTTSAAIAETARTDPDPPCEWRVVRAPRATKAVAASAAAANDAALLLASLQAVRHADAIYQRHTRFSVVGALLAHLTGKPLILEYNSPAEFVARHWSSMPARLGGGIAACESASLAAAARIIVVSDIARKSLIARGIAPERIVVNPNGVDSARFTLGGGSEVRRRHGIADDRVVVGFVGSFGPWHGAPVLARAFTQIAPSVRNTHLLLVGDGQELGSTLGIVRDAGLEGRMTVVGQVATTAVPAYVDACDVLVAPHVPLPDGVEFFGSPTKLFEYMAAGKTIVASRLGQIDDVLEHGVTAWMVEPGSVDDVAKALIEVVGDPALRDRLGTNARRQASEHHSWRRNARRVIDAYSAIAAGAA